MDYSQTLQYLYSQLPMYHRIGPAAYKADLSNTIALVERLDNPQNKFISVHIAGTNGKGSVAHMLASVFQEQGYKTGLCTSPHLKDFRERFRVNGKMVPEQFVSEFVENHMPFFDHIKPSFFEMTIAMTFEYFASENVDVAVIETGLGGRLDSTNVVTPELSIITNIGLDHTQLLGDTIEKIAGEKAGIIKPGVPVVLGKCKPQARDVIVSKASELGSPIWFADDVFKALDVKKCFDDSVPVLKVQFKGPLENFEIKCPLSGTYQIENFCTVLTALHVLNDGNKKLKTSPKNIVDGFYNVIRNTSLQGRWQFLQYDPPIICDTGHNEDGIRQVVENIKQIDYEHLHFVLGMVEDKDLSSVLSLLPVNNCTYYFCRPNVPRGMDAEILAKEAHIRGLKGGVYADVKSAFENAKRNANMLDLIFVGGSTFVVAEVL